MITSVFIILLMLLLSAFFSGMEIAFTSKNRLKLEIDRKQSRLFNFIADIFARHPGQYITTILVGNNIALVIYSLYMSLLLRSLAAAVGWTEIARGGSVVLETAVSTIIIIFVAEFLPKSVFRNSPNFYYRLFAPAIYFFYLLLFPIAKLTTWISQGILWLMGRKPKVAMMEPIFDRTDLASLFESGKPEAQHEPDNEIKLFQNALDFADLRVRDCMVPRIDMEAVDIDDTSIKALTARFVESKYSRIFVWKESVDNIVGYVNSKSLFRHPTSIDEVLMEVQYVPETMPLQALMQRLIRHKSNIAVVIDEFGGTAGIISIWRMFWSRFSAKSKTSTMCPTLRRNRSAIRNLSFRADWKWNISMKNTGLPYPRVTSTKRWPGISFSGMKGCRRPEKPCVSSILRSRFCAGPVPGWSWRA